MKKRCIKCQEVKPIEEFNFKNKQKGRRNGRCKQCTRVDIRAAYQKNREHYLRYRAVYNQKLRDETTAYLYTYLLAHPCVDCGVTDPVVLHFDHVRGKKKLAISIMVRKRYPLNVIKEEIKKCDIRCANCHSRKTARDFGHYAAILEKLAVKKVNVAESMQ